MTNPSNQELTPMKEAQLLPCPFCGPGELQSFRLGSMQFVQCQRCDIERTGRTEAEAISAWNQRTTPPEPVVARGLLREARIDLDLARNRLRACSITAIASGLHREQYEWGEWAKEADAAVSRIDATLSTANAPTDALACHDKRDNHCPVCGWDTDALDPHTLEEAAKVCDSYVTPWGRAGSMPDACEGAAQECGKRIRALAQKGEGV